MQATPPYDDILDDETLAPLKRNHACLQCKKRKVKCDAVRPTCNPCLRSHAHALRSAQRNKSRPPPLVCTYTEDDDEAGSGGGIDVDAERKRVSSLAKTAKKSVLGNGAGPDRKVSREKELRAAEERETLKSRIAELEARIAGLTTSSNDTSQPSDVPAQTSTWTPPQELSHSFNHTAFPTPPISTQSIPTYQPQLLLDQGSVDFAELLMIPASWPRNLPAPPILEHLIETFFQCEPQITRIIHRPTLLTRLKLPPTNRDFPFPALLHAICATAAPHTAWTVTIPPQHLEDSRFRHVAMGLDLETSEDFATAQCEAAERCIRHGTMTQMIGGGQFVFDLVRAHLLLSYTYLNSGMALRAWMVSGNPGRLIKALEINNKKQRNTVKASLMVDPKSDSEREERLATMWLAYLTESGFSINACWGQNLSVHDIAVSLPTSTDEFLHRFDGSGAMAANPQCGQDEDVMYNHPMPDPFVLTIKSSILLDLTNRWVLAWGQRDAQDGDEMDGLKSPGFLKIQRDITMFQSHLPDSLRNVYRIADSGDLSSFDVNLLSVHVYPNVALAMLHEPFADWDGAEENDSLRQVQKAFEAVTGVLHLIPSQLDVSFLFTPVLCFSLFTIGRFVLRCIVRARKLEQFTQAMRWRSDYQAIVNLFQRYSVKHLVGTHLIQYLANHQIMYEAGSSPEELRDACARDNPNQITLRQDPRSDNLQPSTAPSSDLEFLPSLSTGPSQSGTSNTSPNQWPGHSPDSLDAGVGKSGMNTPYLAANGNQATNANADPNAVASQLFDPLEYLNPMDPNAADRVAAAMDKQQMNGGLTEQMVNEMLLAGALGETAFNQTGNEFSWN